MCAQSQFQSATIAGTPVTQYSYKPATPMCEENSKEKETKSYDSHGFVLVYFQKKLRNPNTCSSHRPQSKSRRSNMDMIRSADIRMIRCHDRKRCGILEGLLS